MSDSYYILTFSSNYLALKAEKFLKKFDDLEMEFIPVPREISSECGVCLKVSKKLDEFKELEIENIWQTVSDSNRFQHL